MPRRRAAPRLYLDPGRKQWVIRDGASFVRTGCAESDRGGAEKRLSRYLGQKHTPERGSSPLIADVLLVYAREHVPHIKGTRNTSYNIATLAQWWGHKTTADITARACREYARSRSAGGARRDLEVLRAAIGYWRREYGLQSNPVVVLPSKGEARSRWLTRREAGRLLRASRGQRHLQRFILLGLYTGSRPGAILSLKWDQIDLAHGVMHRRAAGVAEDARKRTPPVRLGNRILAHLRRWRRLDDGRSAYLCHYDGRRIAKLRTSFPKAVARAGLDTNVIPHTLRHTRATWLMQAGVPIWEAAGHLGMTVEMLQRTYGHHHPEWQKAAANA